MSFQPEDRVLVPGKLIAVWFDDPLVDQGTPGVVVRELDDTEWRTGWLTECSCDQDGPSPDHRLYVVHVEPTGNDMVATGWGKDGLDMVFADHELRLESPDLGR